MCVVHFKETYKTQTCVNHTTLDQVIIEMDNIAFMHNLFIAHESIFFEY